MSEQTPASPSHSSIGESGYQFLKHRSEFFVNGIRTDILEGAERFVDFFARENRSDLTKETIKTLCRGKYRTHWKGVEVGKDPLDMIIYQQLIWELKPRTIIELGAFVGGTAVWMADIMRMYDLQGRVYSADIDLGLLDERVKSHPHVTFIEGDLLRVAEVFPESLLNDCPHPWIVIEDSHVNVKGSLAYFHTWMQDGDYFVLDDTNPDTPAVSGMGLYEDLGYELWGLGKLNELNEFMRVHGPEYRIDAYYTDMFGYNGTWNWNGYLRRMTL